MEGSAYVPCRRDGYSPSIPSHDPTIDPYPPNGIMMPWSQEHIDTMKRTSILLAARNWVLIPLRGKKPTLNEWQTITNPQEALSIVIQRLDNGSANNVGVVTGTTSDLLVIDIDITSIGKKGMLRSGYTLWNHWIKIYGDPKTLQVRTGKGGLHIFFRYSRLDRDCSSGNQIIPGYGIDLRANGGQIVIMRSVHPITHHPYTVINTSNIIEIPDWLKKIIESGIYPKPQIEISKAIAYNKGLFIYKDG